VPPDTELLDLSVNHISVIPERSFGRNRRLRFLLLQNNVSVVEDGGFSQMEFLQKLDLSRNRISALTEGFSWAWPSCGSCSSPTTSWPAWTAAASCRG